jgi:hypothetical protein
MKRILIILLAVLLPASLLTAAEVSVIMKDGAVVKGNMLGKTSDELYLQGNNGKAKIYKIGDIKSVFDAKGAAVDLTAGTNPLSVTNSGTPELAAVPGTDVRYLDNNGDIIYFYGRHWWRYGGGNWYTSEIYSGPWAVIDSTFVPYPVFYWGPRWHYGWAHRHYFYNRDWDRHGGRGRR